MSEEKVSGYKRFLIPHPFYFGLFPIVFFYAIYAMLQMQPDVLVIPLVVQLVASFSLYFLLLVIHRFKNPDTAAIQASAFWTFFYTLTYILILDKTLSIFAMEDSLRAWMPVIIVCIWALLLALVIMASIKKTPPTKVTSLLNQVGGFLMMLELLVIVSHELQVKVMWEPQLAQFYSAEDNRIFQDAISDNKKPLSEKRPDIYFLLVDEFPSNFVLRTFYNYDNEPFLQALEKRGFVVPRHAHSNYPRTMLTLSSMLNMTYLDPLAAICGANTTDWSLLFDLIRKGRVIELLKAYGYNYVHFGSTVPPSDWNPNADHNFPGSLFNSFNTKLVLSSLPGLFKQTHEFLEENERRQRLSLLNGVQSVPDKKGNKFVFAHILLPHEPFLFGKNGEPVHVKEGITGEQWWQVTRDGFRDQTIFLENKLLETIDAIIAKSDQQPIIIIQGDHGPNSAGFITKPDPNKDVLVERFGILSAYLVPKNIRGTITDTITPVNVFRLVLNDQLKTTYSPLPDKSYYSAYPYPFRFVAVTKEISAQEKVLSERKGQPIPGSNQTRP